MIRINLTPYREARREKQLIRYAALLLIVTVLSITICVVVDRIYSAQFQQLKETSKQLQAQNFRLKKKVGKIRNLASLRDEVEHKLAIIDRLQSGRFHSLNLLHELSVLIPEHVWLREVKDLGRDITLTGVGESNKAIARFMRKLEDSSIFENVRLEEIRRVLIGGVPVRDFSLKITYSHASQPVEEK